MSLLTLIRQQKKVEVIPEENDYRIMVDGYLPTCMAGIEGQKQCRYYMKGFEPIPGSRYCGWFGRDDASCMRPEKTKRHL